MKVKNLKSKNTNLKIKLQIIKEKTCIENRS